MYVYVNIESLRGREKTKKLKKLSGNLNLNLHYLKKKIHPGLLKNPVKSYRVVFFQVCNQTCFSVIFFSLYLTLEILPGSDYCD